VSAAGGPRPGRRDPRSERAPGLIKPGGLVDQEALPAAVHAGSFVPDPDGADPTEPSDLSEAPLIAADPDALVEPAGGLPDDDAPNRVVFVLRRDLQKRLDRYLSDRIGFMSRTQLQRLIDEGGVTVNQRRPKASTKLGLGDRVEVFLPAPPAHEIPPEPIALDVLYEDEHLIVLNKQADIIVHPARTHLAGTLINALAYRFLHQTGGSLSGVGREHARPGVVHRLDRHTTGAIVFAKTDEAHWKLARQFERRTVDKRYLAIVHGHVEPALDVIDLPIGPHPSRLKGYREKYVVRHDHLGKPAVTIYRVLGRYGAGGATAGCSLVEVELKTGRTHQIRVHLAHLGWPLVGDDMYGGTATPLGDAVPEVAISRQALHAMTLGFEHPVSEQPMSFRAPLPPDLRDLLTALRLRPGHEPEPPPGAALTPERILSGA